MQPGTNNQQLAGVTLGLFSIFYLLVANERSEV